MADPLKPDAWPDNSGNAGPGVHIGNTNSRPWPGLQVDASIAADTIWYLKFELPEVLPGGQMKLRCRGLATAVAGVAKFNPKWAAIDTEADENYDTATLNAEGTTTMTWAAGDSDTPKETKITLDAIAPAAGDVIYVAMTFETIGWTLAVVSTWDFSLIWE